MKSPVIYIDVTVIATSRAAILVRNEAGREAWLGQHDFHSDSQIDLSSRKGEEGILALPENKAARRGLV